MNPEDLERAFCCRSTITHGERITSPVSARVANNVREAFMKGIYGRLFVWVVKKINEAIYDEEVEDAKWYICS